MEIRRPWPFFKVLYSPLPRPSQLLQMRLGEAEVASAEQGTSTYFSHIQVPAHLVGYLSSSFPFQDLLTRCLTEDPSSRITAEEALAHPLFHMQPPPLPQPADLALLPSPVLHVTHDSKDGKSEEEMLACLRSECAEYGEITECCVAEGGGAFVHFQEVRAAKRALLGLPPVCTNNPSDEDEAGVEWLKEDVVKHPSPGSRRVGFYPLDLWRQRSRLIAH